MEMTSTRTVTTFEMEGGSGGMSVTRSGGSGGTTVTKSGGSSGSSVTRSGGSGEVSMQIIREGQSQVCRVVNLILTWTSPDKHLNIHLVYLMGC